jgi:hypothetical protein
VAGELVDEMLRDCMVLVGGSTGLGNGQRRPAHTELTMAEEALGADFSLSAPSHRGGGSRGRTCG